MIKSRRLGAELNGLRTRGLAVGSSPLPWAQFKLTAPGEFVKGLDGLDGGGVCSRDARSSSGRPITRPDTVARPVARQPDAGDGGKPAGSIARPPTAGKNAATRAAVIGVAAPSAAAKTKPGQLTPRSRTSRVPVRKSRARASAQRTIPDFFAATALAVKSTSRALVEVPVSGFVASRAVRRYGE
jgi:hypothetical protein